MRTRAAVGLVAAGFSVVLLVACGDDDGDPAGTTTTTTTTGPSTSTTGDPAPDPAYYVPVFPGAGTDGDILRDGRHFGYLSTLVIGDDGIIGEIDLADILYGGDAADAAARDRAEYNYQDFYISNVNPRIRPITVDPNARAFDVLYGTDACCDPVETTVARFIAARDAADEQRTIVNLTIEDGIVTEIQEVYFP